MITIFITIRAMPHISQLLHGKLKCITFEACFSPVDDNVVSVCVCECEI